MHCCRLHKKQLVPPPFLITLRYTFLFMRYYIIAGEASGDLHGSNLLKELLKLDAQATLRCWGGDLMQAAGATIVKHYRDLAFMGFSEVLKNLPTILKNISFCKEDIAAFKPDVLVLIDYPGFNLRIAKWAKQQGYKVVYYIAPQVWAWKENRVKQMKQCIDEQLVILPFEKKYFAERWNWNVHYVGHPLVQVIEDFKKTNQPLPLSAKPIVALLPGSRKQEILKKLPVMLEVANHFKDHQFILAQAPGLDAAFYQPMMKGYENVSVVNNKTYAVLQQAKAALVTSGTATLETALFKVPEVICYKGNAISYQIAKRLIKIKYICLVNLIMDKPVVKELIQDEMNTTNLVKELQLLLHNETRVQQLKEDYNELYQLLAGGGAASANAAAIIYKTVQP
jgi:lipid-A-disaccharide synthase